MKNGKKISKGSLLDSYNRVNVTQIHGFFNFVYLALYFWLVTSIAISYIEVGTFPGMHILETMVSRVDLVPAWLLLCNYSFLAFFLQKAIIYGLPLKLGLIIHHILQIILFSLTIYWLLISEWPLIQTCFFLAQMLCIWMKMHSYTYVNRDSFLSRLKSAASPSPPSLNSPSPNTKREEEESTIQHDISTKEDNAHQKLTKRNINNNEQNELDNINNKKINNKKDKNNKKNDKDNKKNKDINSSDSPILREKSNGKSKSSPSPVTQRNGIKESPTLSRKSSVRESPSKNNIRQSPSFEDNSYPKNINLKDFVYFLCVPTLVYDNYYARTTHIRWKYIFEKVFTFLGFFFSLHICITQYILPVLDQKETLGGVIVVIKLIMPFTCAYMIIFYLVFDVICNTISEIMCFAEREFYTDWWNSTSWDEFANKWNQPVHLWLKNHVFLELRIHYAQRAYKAIFITFLFSSLLHELFMTVLFKKIRPFLFLCQMSQLVLVWLGNFFNLKGTNAGNVLFWAGMSIGPPLITLIYCL
eukprot:TRINITY_DN15473_c0_g1_i1.p1 TRINITY_DN15473_c0_g1~~TRINITY_DN15473_c0_g1_i1.p1  ORF type:complete len:529 (-),score=94.06 TRINITY_DN15473_c0_g1_i1:55-1641(-)